MARDPEDAACEIYSRGYTATLLDARNMARDEPNVARALLRFHPEPEMRHIEDTASTAEWGHADTGEAG